MPDFQEVAEYIQDNAKPKDIVLTLGAGTITDLGPIIVNKAEALV